MIPRRSGGDRRGMIARTLAPSSVEAWSTGQWFSSGTGAASAVREMTQVQVTWESNADESVCKAGQASVDHVVTWSKSFDFTYISSE